MFSWFWNKEEAPMWLFVGLGNPGKEYAKNRHNVGFMVMDELCSEYRAKFKGAYGDVRLGGEKIGVLKPGTYMNESGQAVRTAVDFFKIKPDRVVVFHDELDLKAGEVRVKRGGGTAGHNGLKSIQAHLGTPEFWRVRIGIGHPGDRNLVSNYVLSDFSKAEEPMFEDVVYMLSKHADCITSDGVEVYGDKISELLENK